MPRDYDLPSQRVFDALKQRIESGELEVGSQMPSMDTIAAEYKISRTTARKVIQQLAAEGYVEVKPRWGTFVR